MILKKDYRNLKRENTKLKNKIAQLQQQLADNKHKPLLIGLKELA